MRIVSAQRDYYDSAQAYGQDRSVTYIRTAREEFIEGQNAALRFPIYYTRSDGIAFSSFVIGFCGQLYPVLCVADKWCYTLDDVDRTMQHHLNKKELAIWHGTGEARLGRQVPWWRTSLCNRPEISRYFREYPRNDYDELFLSEGVPVFVATEDNRWHGRRIVWNALLRPYEFFRVKDAYTAYQEIHMWLANQAEPRKSAPIISDELKAQSKGFDKWSFRKQPSKK